ncbi:dihydrofolate reductase [Dyadobacter luteus]|uniref:Dihydrofolate reductase n=1 Tax=Dyadobacter luteus TaxID=2259619 RepID=A0A3D8YBI1_9BACT|nr:NAD(P)-dependent oxidoreductase [Dyadobacter luteus]REA61525.1 dihydrofolate reductase [Dyadobacter luteus]
MAFEKIVIIDSCGLTQPELSEIEKYSSAPMVVYDDVPGSEEGIILRIGDADAVLVSWRTRIPASVLNAVYNVKYIGMCCSLYDEKAANVDIARARELGIAVKGVRDYGDEGTVEFLFAQLIALFKGFGQYQWRTAPAELKGKSIGIIGMGTLGAMVAETALHFGMEVFYFNRSRKPELEAKGITYLSLSELMATCDIITTHTPKNALILSHDDFQLKKPNSIFINTSLGPTFEKEALAEWLKRDGSSFAIFDLEGIGVYRSDLESAERVILYQGSSGSTAEAKKRLSQKVLSNIENYLNS